MDDNRDVCGNLSHGRLGPPHTNQFSERLDTQPEREAGRSRLGPQRPRLGEEGRAAGQPGHQGSLQGAPYLGVCCQLSHCPVPWCRGQARSQSHLLSRAVPGRLLPLDCLHGVIKATLGVTLLAPLLRPAPSPPQQAAAKMGTRPVCYFWCPPPDRPLVPELETRDLRPPRQTQPDSRPSPILPPEVGAADHPSPREVFPGT